MIEESINKAEKWWRPQKKVIEPKPSTFSTFPLQKFSKTGIYSGKNQSTWRIRGSPHYGFLYCIYLVYTKMSTTIANIIQSPWRQQDKTLRKGFQSNFKDCFFLRCSDKNFKRITWVIWKIVTINCQILKAVKKTILVKHWGFFT